MTCKARAQWTGNAVADVPVAVIMPTRRVPSTDHHDDTSGGDRDLPPPPPLGDAAARVSRFQRLNPKEFGGTTDPFAAEGWIQSLKLHFQYLEMRDGDRVRCATYMLRDDASLWWEGAAHGVNLATLTSEQFKDVFYDKYFLANIRGRLTREFMSLRQGDLTVAEFIRKFDWGCYFVPHISRDAAHKLRHFMDGLRPTLHRDVMLMRLASYEEATACAFQAEQPMRDINFEMQR
ncbi:uncharacterized protein LOC142523800 [Primulina tabacum]|uniref:uncharacterized protein LOC142523800 n=1 Tax=Primulina tabacum TaxID=48773 RepID=UPI003F596075